MPQLDPTWFASQLFWLAVSFAVLYAGLAKLVLPTLLGVLTLREETRSGDIAAAQNMKSDAERAREQYEKAIAEARANAQQQIGNVLAVSKKRAEQASTEADREMARKLSEAEAKIRGQKEQLMAQLTPASDEIVSMIVDKLVQHKPAADIVRAAVENASKDKGVH